MNCLDMQHISVIVATDIVELHIPVQVEKPDRQIAYLHGPKKPVPSSNNGSRNDIAEALVEARSLITYLRSQLSGRFPVVIVILYIK